jgi:hypothetical protein
MPGRNSQGLKVGKRYIFYPFFHCYLALIMNRYIISISIETFRDRILQRRLSTLSRSSIEKVGLGGSKSFWECCMLAACFLFDELLNFLCFHGEMIWLDGVVVYSFKAYRNSREFRLKNPVHLFWPWLVWLLWFNSLIYLGPRLIELMISFSWKSVAINPTRTAC